MYFNVRLNKKVVSTICFNIFTFSLFYFSSVLSSNAATYYVNSNTGNDASAGTNGAPFKTFHKAYTVASSGDVINLTGTFDWTTTGETGDASGSGYTLSKNLTIIGQGADNTFIQAASSANTADRRVFTLNANVTFQNLTIRNGKYGSQGGGMYASGRTLSFTNVAIENNYGSGGGAAFFSLCTITMTNCTFSGNNSTNYGGAFYSQQGSLTITNCTFTSNTANTSILAVENYNMAGYTLNLTNVTVAYNTLTTTSDYHGHVYHQGTAIVRLKNCLFAKNLSPNTATKHDYLKYSSTAYTVAEYNLIENDYNWAGYGLVNGVNNNIIGNQASAILSSTLALNSSTNGTKTLALVDNSPAINVGSATANGTISIPTSDQRGVARSGLTDIGSFEYVTPPIVSQTGSISSFSACTGSVSASQSTLVSGSNLTSNLVVTAPTGFEVSLTSGSGYASSISISPSSGTVASTTIYIRMTSAATGTPSGNVSVTSTGASTVNLSVSGIVNTGGVVSSIPSGSGTLASPYLIASFANLLWISESSTRWSAYYVQTANIDASATSGTCFNAGSGWSPIGNGTTSFTGNYNGGNYSISNLFISRYASNYIGLFGRTSSTAVITNLGVNGSGVYGNHYVGNLIGDNSGLVDLCFATGNVTNNTNCSAVGGLVGNNTGNISRCYTQNGTVTSVSGSSFGLGGLVGINTGTGLIEKSFSKCTVIATNQQAGGLVGRNGYNSGGTIRNCYATGNVSGNLYCGGLVGYVISGVVENSYSIGLVSISDPAGYAQAAGLAGGNAGTITNCFWDTQTSGKATSSGGTGKTTAQMKTLTTFTSSTWDFQIEIANGSSDIWGMNCSDNNRYPFLSWEGYIGNGCNEWVGTTSTNWATASNWTTNSVPTFGQDVIVSASAVNHLFLDQDRTVGAVKFNNAGKNIVLGNNNLTVVSCSGADANNYIKTTGTGSLKSSLSSNEIFTFNVGKSSYNPVSIANNTGAADDFSVNIIDTVQNNNYLSSAIYVNRTWNISKLNPNGGAGVNFVFTWNSADVENGILTSPLLNHYSSNWETAVGVGTGSGNPITSFSHTGYTGSFSPFAISDASNPLPVELTSFNAVCEEEKGVNVTWTTASEHNSSHFDVLKSEDGGNWRSIATVAAAGNSTNTINYGIIDAEKAAGISYYKLMQYDIDGQLKEYGPISAGCNSGNEMIIKTFPNPSGDEFYVELISPEATSTVITIIDAQGKAVYSRTVETVKGTNLYKFESLNVLPGMYYIQISNDLATPNVVKHSFR